MPKVYQRHYWSIPCVLVDIFVLKKVNNQSNNLLTQITCSHVKSQEKKNYLLLNTSKFTNYLRRQNNLTESC